jgi:hypothetical protein
MSRSERQHRPDLPEVVCCQDPWLCVVATEATGTVTLILAGISLPVQVTLSQPVHACGHYYWSTAEFTILAVSSNSPPTRYQDLFNAAVAIGNGNDQPCPA